MQNIDSKAIRFDWQAEKDIFGLVDYQKSRIMLSVIWIFLSDFPARSSTIAPVLGGRKCRINNK
jgi:hypothetical protein